MDTNAVTGYKLQEVINTATQAHRLLQQAQINYNNAQQLLAEALNNAQGTENYELILEQAPDMLGQAQGMLEQAQFMLEQAKGIESTASHMLKLFRQSVVVSETAQRMRLEKVESMLTDAQGTLEKAESMLTDAQGILARAQSMLPQAQSMLPQAQSMSVVSSSGSVVNPFKPCSTNDLSLRCEKVFTPETTKKNSRGPHSQPVIVKGSLFDIEYDKGAYSQQDKYSPNVLKRLEKNWLNPSCENRKKYDQLRQFRDVALESQLVGIISRITEKHGSEDNNDYSSNTAYTFIESKLVIDTIQQQLDRLKLNNPEIEKNIYRINGESNVIDVSHDLIIVYNEFLGILEKVEVEEKIKIRLITETRELLKKIVSSGESGKFVPTKGHLEFKNLINELIEYLHISGVKFNEFPLDPIAVMRDDIELVIPQKSGCFCESGRKNITRVRLNGRLCTNADCGSGSAYHDANEPTQVCTFPNVFNAVSYKMISTLKDNKITHKIIAYVEISQGLFFEIYDCTGGVSLNSVVELIGLLGTYDKSITQCALRGCGDESDEEDDTSKIPIVNSYYVKKEENDIQTIVELFMNDTPVYDDFSIYLIDLNGYQNLLTEAFCCRAGLKTIGDLSSRVVIQNGGYSNFGEKLAVKVFGTVDKFCGESCLMWVLSGYISGLEYICMKSKKNYEVYKIPKNDNESLKKKLSFIFGLPRVYESKCKDKYLSFLSTTIRALENNKSLTEFEIIQYHILKIISEKYNLRFNHYFSHLNKTKKLVDSTVREIRDINRSNSQLMDDGINKNIDNITKMLLQMPDESYINPSFDIMDLLNEYTMFSDLGTDELQYKLDNKYIKDCLGYKDLKQLLTDHFQQLKITNNLVGKILDILLPYYTAYNVYTGQDPMMDVNVVSFSEFFKQKISSLTDNEGNIIICVTLLENSENTIIKIMDSFIEYYMSEFANKGHAKQTEDNKNSLFDFLVTGSKSQRLGTARDTRQIKFVIEGDGITFSNINDSNSLIYFFENIALERNKHSRGVSYNIEDDVTNWTICDNKLTIPVTIELLLNLKKYIESIENDKNIEKIGSIYSKIEERVRNITEKINSKSAYEQIESETKHTTDTRDRSRSRNNSDEQQLPNIENTSSKIDRRTGDITRIVGGVEKIKKNRDGTEFPNIVSTSSRSQIKVTTPLSGDTGSRSHNPTLGDPITYGKKTPGGASTQIIPSQIKVGDNVGFKTRYEPRGPRGPEGASTKNDRPKFLFGDEVRFKLREGDTELTPGRIEYGNDNGTYTISYGSNRRDTKDVPFDKIVPFSTTQNLNTIPKGGSRKNLHKKTKKVTRRKNKKSPKRKTIKKRKMPKRKNKTRRNK